jgi:hypothetical protein
MKPLVKKIKNRSIAFLVFLLFLVFGGTSVVASEFLLKATSNKKYTDLSNCLKSSDNLFTLCIDPLKEFIIAENKYIKLKNTNESKNRLRKIIKYIKQSTDIFVEKAKKTDNIEDYNRASIAAKFLSKLSPDFKSEYDTFLVQSDKRKQGSRVSLTLSNYFNTIKKKEPELEVIKKLVRIAFPVYESIDANFRLSLDKFFDTFVDRYYEHLVSINKSLETRNIPDVSKLRYRYQSYVIVTKIIQINSRSTEIKQIKEKIAISIEQHFKNIKDNAEEINIGFVSGNALDDVIVDKQGRYINYLFNINSIVSQNRLIGFEKVQEFSQIDIKELEDHKSFYNRSLSAQQEFAKNFYSQSLEISKKSIPYAYQERLLKEAVNRINLNARFAILYFQKAFEINDRAALSSLLTLPTLHFNVVTKNSRFNTLDQFVGSILKDIEATADNGRHKKALEKLSQLRGLPHYLDRYEKDHEVKKLYVIDSYTKDITQQVDSLLDNNEYDLVLSIMSGAEKFPGYLDMYEEKHEIKKLRVIDHYAKNVYHEVENLLGKNEFGFVFSTLSDAEKFPGYLNKFQEKHIKISARVIDISDDHWLSKIIYIAEWESISQAISVINTKIVSTEAKQLASIKILDFANKGELKLTQKLGFPNFTAGLSRLQANNTLPVKEATILQTLISQIYKSWVKNEIKNGKFVTATNNTYETRNGLSTNVKNELIDKLVKEADRKSKNNPEAITAFLQAFDGNRRISQETIQKFNKLRTKVIKRWSRNIQKNGILSCKDFRVLSLGLNAQTDTEYRYAPPIDGPKEKGNFYLWNCNVSVVFSSTNFLCSNFLGTGNFLVDGIEQSFPDSIQQNRVYSIIGKYNRNKTNILNRLIPVLEDTYVTSCSQ